MQDNADDDIMELLVRYMDDEMPLTERTAFTKRLEADALLNERYQLLLSAKQAIRSYGLRQHIQALHKEYATQANKDNAPAKVIRPASVFKQFMRVAAAIIIIFFSYGIYQYSSTNNNKVYNDNYVPYTLSVTRGDNGRSTVDSLYANGNYAAALSVLNTMQQKDQRDYFIEGQCYLQTGNAENAIQAFKQVENLNRQSGQQAFAEETDYYLLLAYIKTNNINEAAQKLNTITSNKQHLFYKNATQMSGLQFKILKMKQP